MTDEAVEVLRAVWSAQGQGAADLDETIGPLAAKNPKSCKNMKHVSFDGLAEPGSDLSAAWRERLAREGKLHPSGSTIRDLVFGPTER